jgi:NAD(P)-dependent dehydrogenase (short-subunit alcohol dehydrogenase family)
VSNCSPYLRYLGGTAVVESLFTAPGIGCYIVEAVQLRDYPVVQAGVLLAVPLGRAGDPDDVAGAAVFLASSDASFIAGTELFVDGGQPQI